ncbi:MAG: iron ABC transporter permease [Glaciimonas sp.]|nr:iron ABC transporter permease [Glaciimonas sp.]
MRASRDGRRAAWVLCSLGLLAMVCIVFACAFGSVELSFYNLFWALGEVARGDVPGSMAATLLSLRLERALSGFVVGAMLALAGVMMQALLRNPLADPYVLGVSGGASVGAPGIMLFFSTAWMVDVAAFAGAIAVALLLFGLAYRDLRGGISDGQAPLLLLTGMIVASGCGALVALMLSVAPDGRLRSMVFWVIGDLSSTQLGWLPWAVLSSVLIFAVRRARHINVMVLHAEAATTLGIHVGSLRKGLFFCAALLTACTVSSAGAIGFVGLIVPHACRFALGPDHRLLLPAATIVGGTFLVVADTFARTVLAPQQLPVGVITALIGVPAFLIQLHHMRRR